MLSTLWRTGRWIGLLGALSVCVLHDAKAQPIPDSPAQRFQALDSNRDDRLSVDEMLAALSAEQAPHGRREFRVFDADRDGVLTLAEFRCVQILVADAERGPYPDPQAERVALAMSAVEQGWAAWDRNADGSLSTAEFGQATLTEVEPALRDTRIAVWDRDGNDVVARDECRLVLEIAWGIRRPQGELVRLPDGRCVAWMGFKLIDRDVSDSLTLEECRQHGYDGDRVEEVFRKSDADADGLVTYPEWAANPMRTIGAVGEFLRMDTDLDGAVSRAELETGAPDWQRQLAAYVFPGFDRDGNGGLSYMEYAACPLANAQHLWHDARHDTNHNGRLEFAEFERNQGIGALALAADFFARLDLNRDRALDIDEFFFHSDAIPPAQRFRRWDDDGSGTLSEAEFVAHAGPPQEIARRDFRLFDFDETGALSVAEFTTLPMVVAPRDRGALPGEPFHARVQAQIKQIDAVWQSLDKSRNGKMSTGQFVSASKELFTTPLQWLFAPISVDRDGDGMVTRDEAYTYVYAAWGVRRRDGEVIHEPSGRVYNLMHFGHLDRNQDDSLSLQEFTAQPYLEGRVNDVFRQIDADGNGRVSFREWKEMPGVGTVETLQEFRHFDADLDGKVSPAELKERVPDWKRPLAARIFPEFDLDGDGALSLSEYQFCPVGNPIAKWHEQIPDPDDSGFLTFQDFTWAGAEEFPILRWEYFSRFDRNQDGRLSNDEFIFRSRVPDAFFVMNADGTGWRKLFNVPGYQQCGSPAVSPDGRTVAFDACQAAVGGNQAGPYKIFSIGIDGTRPRELCTGNMPTWSPDGYYFACSRGGQPHGVWQMHADGKESRHVCGAWGVQWSPDGSKLAYYQGTQLLVHDLATDKTHEVLGGEANPYQQIYWNFTWSPDSTRICLKGQRSNGVEEVAVVNASGAELGFRVRHAGGAIYADFAWHPQGNRIVFSMMNSERGRFQLYEFDPDGDEPPALLPGQDPELNNQDACWTPDGRQLIVVSGDF